MKRVLIETGHPAQVHQFAQIAKELQQKGHTTLFVTRDKELCLYLLKRYDLDYKVLGKSKRGITNKILHLPYKYMKMLSIIRKFKPDILISRFSAESSHAAWLMRVPHIAFTDSEHIQMLDKLTVPFVNIKITAHSYTKDLGKNHFRYKGNIELFYLHPKRFKPDNNIYHLLNLTQGSDYAIVRFISWDAYHDIKEKGFNEDEKISLIESISRKMPVFISAEDDLPDKLKKYRFNIPAEKMHDALAFATIYVGEGASMASEAAMLGTPSVYVNSLTAGSIEDAAKAGLIYSFRTSKGVVNRVEELLSDKDLKQKHINLKNIYIEDKIDIAGVVCRFIDEYPGSLDQLNNKRCFSEDLRM